MPELHAPPERVEERSLDSLNNFHYALTGRGSRRDDKGSRDGGELAVNNTPIAEMAG